MRKIESAMLNAIHNRENFSGGNTLVSFQDNVANVYLHGHHIASVAANTVMMVEPNIDTLLQWPSNTTLSRLRALGIDVCKRKGDIVLDGKVL